MNNTQKIGIGVVVLGVLGYAAFVQAKKDQQIGTVQKDGKVDLPDFKGTDDVDKIAITNADKGEVVLEKKGDKWILTKPVSAPANQANVKSLLDNMKELKASELIEATPSDDVKKTYQLEAAHAVHVVTFKGADKKMDETFGKSGGRGQMAMAGDKPGVYAVTGYSPYLYAREAKAWRENEILKFDDANAIQLTIDKAATTVPASAAADAGTKKIEAGTLSFTKNGDHWTGTLNGKAIERFDEDKVKDALRTLKALNADDFGDGKAPADTGLDKPESTVTVTLKDNAGKYVLRVGKTASGTNRYAQKDGDETIYVISSYAAEWALPETSKFQKPLDGGTKDGGSKSPPMGMPGMPMGMPGMPGGGMPPGHP